MPLLIGGGLALGAIGSGVFGYLSAQEQSDAAAKALAAQTAEAEKQRQFNIEQSGRANSVLGNAQNMSTDALQRGYAQGISSVQGANTAAAGQMGQGYQSAMGALGQGFGDANQSLQTGYANATGAVNTGYGNAQSALAPMTALQAYGTQAAQSVGSNQRTDALLNGDLSRQNAYAGFEASPDYQFRKQQGEQAIERSASAAGGRLSGRSLQALTDYNSNLAASEYNDFANRRTALNSQQLQASQGADSAQMAAAIQAQQNQMGLARIGYNAQGQLSNLAQSQGNTLAGLATSQGAALAGNQTALGQLGAQYGSQYGANLANLSQTGGQQLSSLYTGQGSGLANIYGTTGANMASNLTGVSNLGTQLTGSMMPAIAAPVQYAGAGTAAIGAGLSQVGSNALFAGLYGQGNK